MVATQFEKFTLENGKVRLNFGISSEYYLRLVYSIKIFFMFQEEESVFLEAENALKDHLSLVTLNQQSINTNIRVSFDIP